MTHTVGEGEFTFLFDDAWSLGHHDGHTDGWAHHGISMTSSDEIVTIDEHDARVLVIDVNGRVVRSFPIEATEAHALLVTRHADEDRLWVCDNGSKQRRQSTGDYRPSPKPLRGAVILLSLTGAEIGRLPVPPLPVYDTGDYCPAAIAVDERRHGGTGDIWVADCYGQSLVHRFDADGEYLATLDGTSGAGRFLHPHALLVDRRGPEPVLLVADRGNRRIQVHRLDASYVRSFGADHLLSPSALARYGEFLFVGELHGRIAVLDIDGEPVAYLGPRGGADIGEPAWPNALGPDGPVRPTLQAGRFHTPHGVVVHPDGDVYVCEWLIGGRLVKLRRTSSP